VRQHAKPALSMTRIMQEELATRRRMVDGDEHARRDSA
jgi:hypothetical protein